MESEYGCWPGWGEFHSESFFGDAILAEAEIGNISMEVVEGRGWIFRIIFGQDIINEVKTELVGKWSARGLVMGFDIDTVGGIIAVPPPKIEADRIFATSEEFVVGSQHIGPAALQTLRGYMRRWLLASMFRASSAQPVDLLMTYSSEEGDTINCPDIHIWGGFWDMMSLLHPMDNDAMVWPTLFRKKNWLEQSR